MEQEFIQRCEKIIAGEQIDENINVMKLLLNSDEESEQKNGEAMLFSIMKYAEESNNSSCMFF